MRRSQHDQQSTGTNLDEGDTSGEQTPGKPSLRRCATAGYPGWLTGDMPP